MTERGSLILPSVGGDDKVNAGIANPIDIQCMYKPTQYMPYSGRFKPRDDYFKQQMNEEELNSLSKLSKEESDDGIASKRIFMLRMDCPIDPYNTTYENLKRRGICDILMTKQFKAFTLGLEIGRQIIAEHYGDANVDDKEMADDGRKRINYACAVHRRPCWCPPNADAESAVNLLDQCTNDTPLPLNITCPFRKHSERCFCLMQAEEESSLFSMLSVDDLNECDSVQEQCDYLSQCNIPFQDLGTPSPFEAEDEPVVIMEMIPKEGATQEDGVMDIPLAIRFIYIIPENSTVNFGSVIQRMIGEYGSKKRKSFKRPTQYQQHRNIRTRYQFLHLVGEIMWGQRMQYTNPQLNKDCPSITMNEDNFVKGISMILGFEYDLRAVCSSISSVDKGTKNWQQVLHKDSAKHCFDWNSYFYGGKFCPTMQVQRNMILLDSELLELKNDNHVVLKKYNLWHYIEQKRYYDRRFKSEQGEEVSEPQNATTESNSGNLYNPQSMTSELFSNLNTDLFNDLPETDQHRIQQSVRRWKSGQEGAGLNTFRFRQQCDLALYADEGRHLKTNEERREYYDKWISKSIQDFRRYSNRQDLFLSTRGALDFVKNLKGEWNPLILGFKKLVSPSVGVGDMFIAELFYVSESLFYVSTHTGIVLFCFVCTADAFDERLNKNNWIFRGAPDGGKSFISNKVKDAMLIKETILAKTKQTDAALDDIDVMDYRNMMEEANMNLWLVNPKYSRIQDEEKNKLTSGVSISLKKAQFKGADDIVRWKSVMVVSVSSMQISCSTNETQLEKKCIPAMLSRIPPKDLPKMKRNKGRRGVSDMNSAKQQESSSKRRRAGQFCNKYRYYDSLRFLIYKSIDLGILTQPTRTAYDMIMEKLKAYLKKFGISLDYRTEDRCYGKAKALMILRILTTLFEFPKPGAKLVIAAVPYSNSDTRMMKDSDFKFRVHEEDKEMILKQLNEQDNFENIRFVDSTGRVVDTLFVKMGAEKAYNKKDKCIYQLRTIQESNSGRSTSVHCPESLVGEFYRQWVSIHHSNFEHFIKCVSPLMTISLEDTVRAIWMSRSEFMPDRYILFQRLLLRLGINCLKKEALRNPDDEKKRRSMFKTCRVEVAEDSDYATNYSYIKLGKRKEVVSVLASDYGGKSEESNTYPEGYEIYFDNAVIRDMLENLTHVKDTQGYLYKTPSRLDDENNAYWGVVNTRDGKLPNWRSVGPDGKTVDDLTLRRKWYNFTVPDTFTKEPEEFRYDWAKAAYAKRQRSEPSLDQQVSKKHFMPVVEITESNGAFRPSSEVYLNVNWIEQNFKTREQKLEDVNPLIIFFQSLGYRHDGIPITIEQKKVFQEECRQRMQRRINRNKEEEPFYRKQYKQDLARLNALCLKEGQPDSDAGLKILLGDPFLGYTVDEEGKKDQRTCTPQLSMSVTVNHTEKTWFTEAANVPSQTAAEVMNLSKSETEKKRIDLVLPLNDFATMKRMDFLCILEDGATVEDYKSLWEDVKFRRPDGSIYYPYRFASPNHIRKQIHELYDGEYPFTSNYPHDAAWHEEKSYDSKRELVNGQWKWVKYDFAKNRSETNFALRDEMKLLIEKRFGTSVVQEPEADCSDEVLDPEEEEVEAQLNELILGSSDDRPANPEAFQLEEEDGEFSHRSKRVRNVNAGDN